MDQKKIQYPQSLYYLLDVLDLKDRWCSVNFSVINNGSKFGGIHYDFVLGSEKYLALNIPLLNCKNSFNVWYSGQPGEKIKIGTHSDRSQVILNKDDDQNQGEYTADTFWTDGDIFELKRVECDKPMLVHIGRPHQPEVIHTDLRVLLSLRFRPELSDQEFDYITSKYAM